MTPIDWSMAREQLMAILREDVGSGDITSRVTVPEEARAIARYTTKEALVVAGVSAVAELCRLADPPLTCTLVARDGDAVEKGAVLAEARGSARSILTIERATLNLLQRMCGIASLTREYVERVAGTRARFAPSCLPRSSAPTAPLIRRNVTG